MYDVTRDVSRMRSNSKGGAMLSIYDIQNQFVGKSFCIYLCIMYVYVSIYVSCTYIQVGEGLLGDTMRSVNNSFIT